jgi:hypothetical protein
MCKQKMKLKLFLGNDYCTSNVDYSYSVATACTKLGIQSNDCTIVDEKDGSVIDEEEVLQEFKGGILMLLTGDEVWSPATSLSGDSAPVGTPTSVAGCC